MQYLLMLYAEEAGWNKLTKAEQEQGVAAYKAYTEALTKAGVLKGSNRLQPTSAASTSRERQAAGAGWPVCGVERADRRLLSYRRGRSGCGDLLGLSLPGRKSRCRRGASNLVHASVSCAAG